jgi:O-antigen/teichoic acid export membrane protein
MRKQIFTYLIGKGLPSLINLLIIIYGVKYLGKEQYGFFSLAYATILIAFNFSFGWLQQVILRFWANISSQFSENYFFKHFLFSECLMLLITFSASYFYFSFGVVNSLIISFAGTGFLSVYYLLSKFQAAQKASQYARLENLFFVSFFVLSMVFYWLNLIQFIFYMAALGIASWSVSIIFHLKNYSSIFEQNSDFVKQKTILEYAWPIGLWLSVASLLNFSDRILIGKYCSIIAVAEYSAVYDLYFKIANLVCLPVLMTLHPKIMHQYNTGQKELSYKLIKKGVFWQVLIGLITIILAIGFSKLLLINFLKISSTLNYYLIISLLASSFGWNIALLLHKPLEMQLKSKHMLLAIVIVFIVNVILNIFLLPVFGYVVAAYITLFTIFLYIILVLILIKYLPSNR